MLQGNCGPNKNTFGYEGAEIFTTQLTENVYSNSRKKAKEITYEHVYEMERRKLYSRRHKCRGYI